MIVQSFGQLTTSEPAAAASAIVLPTRLLSLSDSSPDTYAALYRTQPNVRTCCDFLGRNLAQIGIHTYRRVSDTDRLRLTDHQMARWLAYPNPATTRYRLIESTIIDLAIFFSAYWLKVRRIDGEIGLVRLPPQQIEPAGWLMPSSFIWTPNSTPIVIEPSEIVYFTGYDPDNPLQGLSPLETLRGLLEEEQAASEYRATFFENSARIEGVVERPKDAPRWTREQKDDWRSQWAERYAGPMNQGKVPVLEDGMTYKTISHSARESEFVDARKLTREEVAAAYHIPAPMVGILDHATFSNIREQHKELYADCLGPWTVMVEEELDRQLLPECQDSDNIYNEFNIAEKLKGSFEEQANALRITIGRPIMTANEGRARLNLPAIKDDPTADQLAMPLNTSTGQSMPAAAPPLVLEPNGQTTALSSVLAQTFARQRARIAKEPEEPFDLARWDKELATDLLDVFRGYGLDDVDATHRAMRLAARINTETQRRLTEGLDAFPAGREATYGE